VVILQYRLPRHCFTTPHDDSNDFILRSNAINTICGCGHEFPQLKKVLVHSQANAARCAAHCSNGPDAVARSYPSNSVGPRGFVDCCTQMHSDFAGKRMAVGAKSSHGRWLYGFGTPSHESYNPPCLPWKSQSRLNHVDVTKVAVVEPLGPNAQRLDSTAPHTKFQLLRDPKWVDRLEAGLLLMVDHGHMKLCFR
jgi:hypothetical protein